MHEWAHFFDKLFDFAAYLWQVSYTPLWNMLKSSACGWIAVSIMRFKPSDETRFKPRVTLTATALFMLCIMELSRVITGIATGVSPFVSLILLMIAYRLHVAKGNVSHITPA